VSVGLAVGGRFAWSDLPAYIIAQVIGATLAAFLIWFIAAGAPDFSLSANALAVNGYGELSPGKYTLAAGFVTEVVMTMMFLLIILGATDKRAPAASAGIAIGLALTLIHLISIPVTNTSVNPARSTGPAIALMTGGYGQALGQLWMFWLAPIIGAGLAGVIYKVFAVAGEPPEIEKLGGKVA
jgi:aquaporin Z